MRTRFAPSPTGPLHLGHAFSALTAWDMAQAAQGTFLLRIEDIDRERSKPEWEVLIYEDLAWLGLTWPEPVMRQSGRMEAYRAALQALWDRGLLYPCTCSRADIRAALSAPQEGVAPPIGPDGPVYPGTCKHRTEYRGLTTVPSDMALRLHADRALEAAGDLVFTEDGRGPDGQHGEVAMTPTDFLAGIGDIVVARPGFGTSYHLSVTVDDAAQDITHVVRGQDLFEATMIHVLLQRLLDLPTPLYHHHRLIRDEAGKRLAKRDDARAIRTYRDDGVSPAGVRTLVGL
ncbi:tRNA glutamyl-Q(34) synthetase GluQRS [Rhodobacterales bacterium HKCCE3408]|nr:tRNA glutamyl-Q(34) synthetase GluQRS [Rhodobacterales bacterium HKCCE3408]